MLSFSVNKMMIEFYVEDIGKNIVWRKSNAISVQIGRKSSVSWKWQSEILGTFQLF